MARLAFFGTPEFSLPCLHAVNQYCVLYGHELTLVVSQADKEQGRGKRLLPPPVKKDALDLSLNVMQPETLKKGSFDGDQFYEYFSSLNLDLAVVVAYGKLIPERILKIPKRGFVNIHASLLPRFRGAAPVQRAIESGDRKTGVCIMDMVKKLDEGDVYACRETPILPFDTSETLLFRLAKLGAAMLLYYMGDLLNGRLKKVPQQSSGATYAHMLRKEEGSLDFSRSGLLISRKARAFDPWPVTFGFVRGKRIKFFDSFFISGFVRESMPPGSVVALNPFLGIKTIDGVVYFKTMQVEGKRILPIKEALLGFPLGIGDQIKNAI